MAHGYATGARESHVGRRLVTVAGAVLALAGAGAASAGAQDAPSPVAAIPSLDLQRYAGLWHEIARLPNWFQRRCVADVTANYELVDGGIKVVNECRAADSSRVRAEGEARLADRDGPASKLRVRFAPSFLSFLPFVWGDYWVLDLTDDYSAALVGTPDRRYLWILARQPTLDTATYTRLVDTAAREGFDVARLVRSGTP